MHVDESDPRRGRIARAALLVAATGALAAAANASVADAAAPLVAFTEGSSGIYTVSTGGGTPKRIVAKGSLPAWSPSGSQLAYVAGNALYVSSSTGKSAKRIASRASSSGSVPDGGPAAWSPNGKQIAYAANGSVYVVNAKGGKAKRVVSGGVANANHVAWDQAGKHVYFLAQSGASSSTYQLYWVGANGGKPAVQSLQIPSGWTLTPFSLSVNGGALGLVTLSQQGSSSTLALGQFQPAHLDAGVSALSGFSAADVGSNGTVCANDASGDLVTFSLPSGTPTTLVPGAQQPSACSLQS